MTVLVSEPRRTVISIPSPGGWRAIAETRSSVPVIFFPPMVVTTSPAFRPADGAGPPAVTEPTSAPVVAGASPVAMPM